MQILKILKSQNPENIMEQVHMIIWLVCVLQFLTITSGLYFFTSVIDKFYVTPFRFGVAILLPIVIAQRGLKKKSLSTSGAIAGVLVAFFTVICHWGFLFALMGFYVSGSKVTKYKAEMKKRIEGIAYKEGGQRTWVQVFCNSAVGFQICLLYALNVGLGIDVPMDFVKFRVATILSYAYLGALACCNGDTWSSEIGSVVSKSEPIHIISWKKVPRGTNGGVSLIGLLASILGGSLVGLSFYLGIYLGSSPIAFNNAPYQYYVIIIGGLAGLFGSLIDSLLGSVCQYSGWDEENKCVVEHPGPQVKKISGIAVLDNHTVNLVSSFVTAMLTPIVASYIF